MSFDLTRILESKRAYRRELASLPVAEKLAMLDALRDRTLAIRAAAKRAEANVAPITVRHAPADDARGQ
jgi:hypothetical protein